MILVLQQGNYFPQSLNETCRKQPKRPELERVYWSFNTQSPV